MGFQAGWGLSQPSGHPHTSEAPLPTDRSISFMHSAGIPCTPTRYPVQRVLVEAWFTVYSGDRHKGGSLLSSVV